jgi:hypothetical protein
MPSTASRNGFAISLWPNTIANMNLFVMGSCSKGMRFALIFSSCYRNASVFANRELPLSILYTYFSGAQRHFFKKFISFYEIGRKYFDCLEGFAELKYIRVIQQKGGHQTA